MKKLYTLLLMTMLSLTAFSQTNENTQILNGGFEDWGVYAGKSSSSAAEPRYWHSFSSASGTWASLAGEHCFKSKDAHSGTYSAEIRATKVFLKVANGTMTTGRLNAGSTEAADKSNHSAMDMSVTEKDRNGDPYYQVLEARPDSVVFWVKFSTGKAGTCANMSAYITDGTYYQVPEDKTYNNIVGKAENPDIAACSEWTRISVPFTYADNGLQPKAIMLTFSTCAKPGGGKGDEVLLVDDVELIYKSSVTPDNPNDPDNPVTPDNPDNPDDPDTPDTPDTPEECGVSYTDDLVVTVANVDGNEESTTIPASTINISQNSDGSYKLSIKNFALGPGMVLGDVVADNLTGTTDGEYTTIKMSEVPVKLSNEMYALALGDLKINLDAKFTADKLYALIDLNVTLLNQVVNVVFGSPFTETAIDHVTVKNHSEVDQVYGIGGQRVSRPAAPGLYIVNGKKVIIK